MTAAQTGRALPIIFQQGAHKTASSYCAQLLREIAARNGVEQSAGHALLGDPENNGWIEDMKSAVLDDVPSGTVLKTHDVPGEARPLLESGRAIGFITFRDPWDCVVSLMDHARSREGEAASELNWLKTPLQAAELHILYRSFSLLWIRLPNTYVIHYDDLRERPHDCVAYMAAQLNVPVDAEEIVAAAGAPRRLNVGETGRGRKLRQGPHAEELKRMFEFLNAAREPTD